MEKIEIILDNYSQETKNTALVAALKSENSTLVELVLKLKPDLLAGGAELFRYAIKNCDFELLGELLWEPEICENQKLMDEGVRLAVSLARTEKYEVLARLIENVASANVAVEALLGLDHPSFDVITDLIKLGAKVHFWPMHLDKHQLIAEKLFKKGLGKNVEFSNVALEQFCLTICKNKKQGVVKRIAKERPDLLPALTQIAVAGGYTETVRVLHQEKALTTIGDELFEKAISKKHYFTVKYLAKSGIRELVDTDVFNAAAFGNVKMVQCLIEQMNLQGKVLTDETYSKIIRVACVFERTDCVKMLLDEGHKCDFDANIKTATVNGDIKTLELLMKYATKLSKAKLEEAINAAVRNDNLQLACKLSAYADKYPEKFQ